MREIEEERLVFVSSDEVGGILRQQIRGVTRLVFDFIALPPIQLLQPVSGNMGVVVHVATHKAAEFVEAILQRMKRRVITKVPFAENPGVIAGLLEKSGDGQFLRRDSPGPALRQVLLALCPEDRRKFLVGDPRAALLVSTGQQGRARRRAHRTVAVKIGESCAVGRELIDVRCFDFLAAITTQRAVAQVIGHDEDDIRPFFRVGNGWQHDGE